MQKSTFPEFAERQRSVGRASQEIIESSLKSNQGISLSFQQHRVPWGIKESKSEDDKSLWGQNHLSTILTLGKQLHLLLHWSVFMAV